LDRRQLQRVALRKAVRSRHGARREVLEEVPFAPQERKGAAQLLPAEIALHLHLLLVGPPDPQRAVLDVERAAVRLRVIPADPAGLLHLHHAFRFFDPAYGDVRVVLPEAGGEVLGLRVEGLHAAGDGAAGILRGDGEEESGDEGGHGSWTRVSGRPSSGGRAWRRAGCNGPEAERAPPRKDLPVG